MRTLSDFRFARPGGPQRLSRAVHTLAAAYVLGLILLAGISPALAATAPADRKPNLRGEVMILVYHNFGDKDLRWTRSLTSFDRDLARLESEGYRPITLAQFVAGDFIVPAGTTPVVLTFDDGSANQMIFTGDGRLAPGCAVAHWTAFAQAHPDFPMRGVFFVNPGTTPFKQPKFVRAKLRMIVELGGEIGNHTYTHANLRRQEDIAAREIALGQAGIERLLPDYTVHSFALPFGIYPPDQSLAWQGQWHNPAPGRGAPSVIAWHYDAVVKVGANPAASPLVAGFDPHHLPRVQVFDPEFDRWMSYFEKHPERRFISDGRKHAVGSLPAT
jgi:hypothetical protein